MMATVHSEELPPSSLVVSLPDSDSLSKTDDKFASQKIARTTEESVATSPSKSIPLSDEASVASAQSKVVGDLMSRSPDITSRKERGGLKFEVTSGICEGKKNKHDSPYKAAYDGKPKDVFNYSIVESLRFRSNLFHSERGCFSTEFM